MENKDFYTFLCIAHYGHQSLLRRGVFIFHSLMKCNRAPTINSGSSFPTSGEQRKHFEVAGIQTGPSNVASRRSFHFTMAQLVMHSCAS